MASLSMGERKSDDAGCQPRQHPWLLYSYGNSKKVFCSVNPFPPAHDINESCVKSIPELYGKCMLACCHGWLIVEDFLDGGMVSLYNLETRQILHLPPLDPSEIVRLSIHIRSAVLTCPPVDANSDKCLLLLSLTLGDYFCWPKRANCSWSKQELPICMLTSIALDGVIYASNFYKEDFISLEVVDDDDPNRLNLRCSPFGLPVSRFPCFDVVRQMVESCGHIYLVYWHGQHWVPKAVEIWELDLQGRNWVEVKSLDGRAFFLGYKCSTWCWGSKDPESVGVVEENCVYFYQWFGKALYSYNLRDCSFYVRPFTTLHFYSWVMPRHQSLLTRGEWKQRNGKKVDVINQEWFISVECKELLLPIKKKRKYKELPQRNITQENLFCELPLHIIELISKYLHLFDYWNFRASCRIFHSAIPVAQWRTNNLFPLLMFLKNADGFYQVKDPLRNDSYSFILPSSRDVVSIDFSKDGWLLVRFFRKSLKYINLFIGVRGDFPPNEFMDAFRSIGFSTNPTSPDCLTVGICGRDSHVTVHYLRYGDEAWNSCSFYCGNQGQGFMPSSCSPVYHDGAFYFVDTARGHLGVFELVGEEPSWRCYSRYPDFVGLYHLIECDRGLLAVVISDMGKLVKVFRFNKTGKNWVRVKNLGNRILFINHLSSSFSALTREHGNKIFLSRLKGNGIIFYSLDTCKYHVLGNEDVMEDFYGTREAIHSCWI